MSPDSNQLLIILQILLVQAGTISVEIFTSVLCTVGEDGEMVTR